MLTRRTTLRVLALLISIVACSYGQVPKTMSYQGILTDGTGKTVGDGTYSLTFKLYDVITGGTLLWTETQSAAVSKGVFSVILGSSTALNLAFDKPYFLGVSINGAAELVPRMQLTSSAYALNADKVKGTTNVFPSEGNVGIGTTTPMGRMEVKDSLVISGNGIEGGQLSLLDGDRQGGWEFDNYGIGGNEQLRIFRGRGFNDIFDAFVLRPTGNIGIGVADPETRLEVAGVIKSKTGGFKFPDGTIQTSAATDVSVPLRLEGTLAYTSIISPPPPHAILTALNNGFYYGIEGTITSTNGRAGLHGYSDAATGSGLGVLGESDGDQGVGVRGNAGNTAIAALNYGGYFQSSGGKGIGVLGIAASVGTGASNYGGYFAASGGKGIGVFGTATATATGATYGGYFEATKGDSGIGVYGHGSIWGAKFFGDQIGIYANSYVAGSFQGKVQILARQSGSLVMELGEGLDYAEGFDVTENSVLAPGTVLVIDTENPGNLKTSKQAYDTRVAGIVSGAKGLGTAIRVGGNNFDVDVALAGRVYCNVDATEQAVAPGDLLTTSSITGYAMKVTDHQKAHGAILGKAMQPLERGKKGQILVLVTLQ